jgi:hypothetical protein
MHDIDSYLQQSNHRHACNPSNYNNFTAINAEES